MEVQAAFALPEKQPAHFVSAVLVLAVFWLGLVGWWLNGIWNLFEKITHG